MAVVSEPLQAGVALAASVQWREPCLHDGWLHWLEQRPDEQGRTTLLRRPAGDAATPPEELTPAPRNLRSRVHAYGGGSYALAGSQLVFIDDSDRCLWWQALPGAPGVDAPAARRLTEPPDSSRPRAFADGLIDAGRDRWIGVMEQDGRDQLVAVPLQGGEPVCLHSPRDFCGYAVLSPDGRRLAWVEWQQPFMPWQRSQLWLARLDADGLLRDARVIAGSDGASPSSISVFQPLWAGDDLVVSQDRSGWWNLECLRGASSLPPDSPADWIPLLPMQAEFGQPQWVYGLRTTAWDGRQLLAAACLEGRWQLGRLQPSGPLCHWQPFSLPFDEISGLTASPGRLAAIASSPERLPGLLELSLPQGSWQHTPVSEPPLPAQAISRPQALWFPGHGQQPTHAWYYPPATPGGGPAPLLVRGHSGPTGMCRTGLNPSLQFWTSRGWGVVEVNYGGSTGFGRAYRERLDGQWGVVDVDDCLAAARALVAAGRADPRRLAMEGGSAAGFTVLEALARDRTLSAGCCRYPVCDLSSLATAGDHRFEARYFDSLVGPWPQARPLYEARSPLAHPERIQAPVIFLHGLEDPVVPAEQSERMAAALRQQGVPVELHLFEGEGHGFRSRTVQIQVLEAMESFLRRQFGL
ncbi:MAG: prolyl oligopeptidase family serine peptidase [Synechococcaceae cyanobacterium]|nr:prolyl oligopeptidase family serine peptidase [Synechococcaceae cyanobacterium]